MPEQSKKSLVSDDGALFIFLSICAVCSVLGYFIYTKFDTTPKLNTLMSEGVIINIKESKDTLVVVYEDKKKREIKVVEYLKKKK